MAIAFYAEDIHLPAIRKRAVGAWIKAVASTYGKKTGEISYIFCSDEKILEVNRQYLQHDYYTDIITFDYTEGNKISGDLFISLDTVRTNAEAFHTSYNEELSTASCIFAASTTRGRASGRLWRKTKTGRCSYCPTNAGHRSLLGICFDEMTGRRIDVDREGC